MTSRSLRFTTGHGTCNDFVLLPDPDGTADVTPRDVAFLADRRAGLGGDGVIRVVPTRFVPEVADLAGDAAWFMDYRNADGSIAEMCGNGTRVFAAYLLREGLAGGERFPIATRTGVKQVGVESTTAGPRYAVDLGRWRIPAADSARERGGDATVTPRDAPALPALSVDVGNPHTVVVLSETGVLGRLDLTVPPEVTPTPPHGTNVEFVEVLGHGHLRMRVHERGVGETQSCGTGACAAALAVRFWEPPTERDPAWTVDVPGGRLTVRVVGERVELAGPAVLVADGTVILP